MSMEQGEDRLFNRKYAWLVVGILMVLYTISMLDKQVLSLLIAPLRRDLHIGDTQISLLQGFAFSLFYSITALPLGRLTDTYNRRIVIVIGFTIGTILTAACGFAHSFGQLLVLRIGVGMGLALLSPAAYSLIADYFPKRKLASAIAVYSTGLAVGSGLSYVFGGIAGHYAASRSMTSLPLIGIMRTWQLVFLLVALIGFLVLPLIILIREPLGTVKGVRQPVLPIAGVLEYFRKHWTIFLSHNLGFGLIGTAVYAGGAWGPEFLRRHFHWDIGTAGMVIGFNNMIFGALGVVCGGRIADYVRLRGHRNSTLIVGACIAACMVPVNLMVYLSSWPTLVVIMIVPSLFLSAAPWGIAAAAVQEFAPPSMRAQASALYLLVLSVAGLGLGPTAVAVCTQYVFRRDDAIQYSLAIVSATSCTLASLLLFFASREFLKVVESDS